MTIRPTPHPPYPASGFHSLRAVAPEFVQEIGRLRTFRDREFAKLSNLVGRDLHGRVRKLLRLSSLHKLYAYEGLRKASQLSPATAERVGELASDCNPLQPCHEHSYRHFADVGNRRRLVWTYGPAKRGRQMFVADLLRHLHPPLEQQYMFRGGMPAAFRAVEAAFSEGFAFGLEVDFVGFYASVGFDGLAELLRPLPNSVVENVVWDGATVRADGGVEGSSVPVPPMDACPSPQRSARACARVRLLASCW